MLVVTLFQTRLFPMVWLNMGGDGECKLGTPNMYFSAYFGASARKEEQLSGYYRSVADWATASPPLDHRCDSFHRFLTNYILLNTAETLLKR